MNIRLNASMFFDEENPLFKEEDKDALLSILEETSTSVEIPLWRLSQVTVSPDAVRKLTEIAYEEGKQNEKHRRKLEDLIDNQ